MNVSNQPTIDVEQVGLKISEVAEILGVSERYVRKLCGSGRLGRKMRIGGGPAAWVITRVDAESAKRNRRPRGRPRNEQ